MPSRLAPPALHLRCRSYCFRSTTIIGVCVEYVAGVAWVAELFSNPKQRESVLGYTQAAFGPSAIGAAPTLSSTNLRP
jgi:hypothetical protein